MTPGPPPASPGATFTYTCTLTITAPLTNVAEACGTPAAGPDVCDDDDADVGTEHQSFYPDFVPNDFATLSLEGSTVAPDGELTFTLYKGACTSPNELFTQTVNVNGTGDYRTTNAKLRSALLGSTNTGGTYNWQLTYSGDSNGNTDITGACGTENFTVTTGADAP